jgi:uncharacterized phage-associated protein
MPYIKLIKLLYLADRRSLVETGYPITGARMVSMDHGPVLSEVLDLITWAPRTESAWWRYVSEPEGYAVSLCPPIEVSELSEYEIELLTEVHEQYGSWDGWALVAYTHGLPEWTDPQGTSLPIDARTILQDAGKSDEEIQAIAATVSEIRAFHAAFDRAG